MSYKKVLIGWLFVSLVLFLIINLPTPLKIEGDGVFYYSWLRSAWFDRDFDFYNELQYFSAYDVGSKWMLDTNFRTHIGQVPNSYAYGTALLWLPFFLLAHLLSFLFSLPINGYSVLYVFFVNLASWLFGWGAFLIIYLNLKKFFSQPAAFWSALGIYLATPFVYYQFFEPSMSHSASLFIVTLFFHYLIKLYQNQPINFWLLALIIFLMVAVRWQNLLFLITLAPIFFDSLNNLKLTVKKIISILIPVLIFWLTQLLLWKQLYGYYFLQPQGRGFIRPEFHGLYILLASNRGLLLWSPILILVLTGFYWLSKKSQFLFFIALSAFLVQWLINGSLNDLGGGDAFGARRFMETLPFLSLALSALWEKIKIKKLIWLITIIFIFWNLVLIQNYRYGNIPHYGDFNVLKINYLSGIIK